MASVYDLKPRFQALLRPLCRDLAKFGITANQVTIAAIALSAIPGLLLVMSFGAAWPLLTMPVVLFVRMALNAIDGMLAREFGQKSRVGAILNELGDVVSDALLYLPLVLIPGMSVFLVVAIVFVAVVTEMTGVVAVQIGASRRYDGPFGKSDRALFFGALSLLIGFGLAPGLWSHLVLTIALGAGIYTIVNRALAALAETRAAATAGD